MKKWSAVDRLKVRMSYGQTGKVDFPAYCAISTYEVTLDDLYKTGSGVLMKTLGNPNLKWERTNTMDIGMELELFKGVLACNLSYYDRSHARFDYGCDDCCLFRLSLLQR